MALRSASFREMPVKPALAPVPALTISRWLPNVASMAVMLPRPPSSRPFSRVPAKRKLGWLPSLREKFRLKALASRGISAAGMPSRAASASRYWLRVVSLYWE